MESGKKTKAIVLFSGGLDSILACKVLQEQSIVVIALQCITPFFSYHIKENKEAWISEVKRKYGIDLMVVDITDEYLKMLKNPAHGYGRYLNPCIDCKILMIKQALSLMKETGASFIATGEVIGQRPMSQRRDTLRIIERDSGAEGLLLRPLCAKNLKPTRVEEEGLVDRSKLLSLSGRGRKGQMALAEKYSITEYPSPAGGCALADPILSERFRNMLSLWDNLDANDFLLAQVGRHFLLSGNSWFAVGRNQTENSKVVKLARGNDLLLQYKDGPGPTGLLRRYKQPPPIEEAASVLLRYCKIDPEEPCNVIVKAVNRKETNVVQAIPFNDKKIDKLRFSPPPQSTD